MAALIACVLIVKNAMMIAMIPATMNIHHSMFTRYAKSFNHSFIRYHATGTASTSAISTSDQSGHQ